MKHRGLETICGQKLTEELARTPMDHYVVWTGYPGDIQPGSLRARALACVEEVGEPVPLRGLIMRAARLEPTGGLDPERVRSAVRLHQCARRAVYLLLERRTSNDYVAVTDIPWPAGATGPIAAGDVVIDRWGQRRFVCAAPEASVAVG